jgi:outer membrane protein TolC
MFRLKILFSAVLLLFFVSVSIGQQAQTMEEIVAIALERSPLLKARTEEILHDQLLEKSAWHIADPELLWESPTGERMTLGFQQSFEFPTVYVQQRQLLKQRTQLTEQARNLTSLELTRKIKATYLDLQFAIANLKQNEIQDRIFNVIAQSAKRQFQAGQIDKVEETFAALKYAEAHTYLISSGANASIALQQLQTYTGIRESIVTTPFIPLAIDPALSNQDTNESMITDAPMMQYYLQSELIAEREIQLEKSRMLPDFTVGYLNPAAPNTPFPLRMQFGVSVPLWFWQYKTTLQAAKSNLSITKYNTASGEQALQMEWNQAKNAVLKYFTTMQYYETESLVQANEIIQSSGRMFEAGEYDYIKYLTTLSDAYRIQRDYLDVVQEYNRSLIQLQYLIGQ